jgi:hypothetical protein
MQVNRFQPFFSPQLNLWSCHRTHFFLFWHASRLFQKKDKSPEARRSTKNASRPCPPDRCRQCKNTRCIHTPALILAMQLHGGKSCPCGCIARFLHIRVLPLKLVHQHKHDAGKNPLFSTALDHSSPSLSEHRISTPTPTPPPSH